MAGLLGAVGPFERDTDDWTAYWAIPLFNYTPLQMTINGVQGGIVNMSRGVVIKIPVPGG